MRPAADDPGLRRVSPGLRWVCPALGLLGLLCWLPVRPVGALQCNYCYNADRMADCFFSRRQCERKQICFVDTSKVTYSISTSKERTSYMYKMGCAFSSLCKDGVSYGPGPQGYSRIVRQCCCTERCTEGDGAGKGKYDICPWAMPNATEQSNGAPPAVHPDHWWTAWTAIPAILSFIWGVVSYLTS